MSDGVWLINLLRSKSFDNKMIRLVMIVYLLILFDNVFIGNDLNKYTCTKSLWKIQNTSGLEM